MGTHCRLLRPKAVGAGARVLPATTSLPNDELPQLAVWGGIPASVLGTVVTTAQAQAERSFTVQRDTTCVSFTGAVSVSNVSASALAGAPTKLQLQADPSRFM